MQWGRRQGGMVPPGEAGNTSQARQDGDLRILSSAFNNRPVKSVLFALMLNHKMLQEADGQPAAAFSASMAGNLRASFHPSPAPRSSLAYTPQIPVFLVLHGRKREIFCWRQRACQGRVLLTLGCAHWASGSGCHPSICPSVCTSI